MPGHMPVLLRVSDNQEPPIWIGYSGSAPYPEMVEELNKLRIALRENILIAEVHVMKI